MKINSLKNIICYEYIYLNWVLIKNKKYKNILNDFKSLISKVKILKMEEYKIVKLQNSYTDETESFKSFNTCNSVYER